ncbi:hypothetical protein TKK_0015962 [Trichogramma kaykai]
MSGRALKVVITEASSYTARYLAFRILNEELFGPDRKIILSLFVADEAVMSLEGIAIEITACAPNLLQDIVYSADRSVAFHQADWIFFIDKGKDHYFTYADFENDSFFIDSMIETKRNAKAIDLYANKTANVIVYSSTAARILSEYAPSIPIANITVATMIFRNYTASMIAKKTQRLPCDVKNLIIWGTNSLPAIPYCKYARFSDGKYVTDAVQDDLWFKEELPKLFKGIFRKRRYRLTEALAFFDHCKYLINGTPEGEWITMNVCSDGSYGVKPGLFFSFPVYCVNGQWKIVQGLELDDYFKKKIKDIQITMDDKMQSALNICLEDERNPEKPMDKTVVRKSILKNDFPTQQNNETITQDLDEMSPENSDDPPQNTEN